MADHFHAQTGYVAFVRESWKIEGLKIRHPKLGYIAAHHEQFVIRGLVTPDTLTEAAMDFTSSRGRLRDRTGMDVIVGNHRPPSGGPSVVAELELLCEQAEELKPFELHQRFENLHPFLDGNGRTGRLLWLWSMELHGFPWMDLGFLHRWYYQSLAAWKPEK